MKPGSSNRASLTAIIGASGSGKSLWVKQQLARTPKRLMIWDTMAEYGHVAGPVKTTTAVIEQAKLAGPTGGFALVFVPSADAKLRIRQFDIFCGVAFALGRVTLVVEELANVTKAGWSPAGWLRVVTQGRHKGLTVIGTTQRPQLVDKTFLDNATTLRVGRLNTSTGRRTMADMLDTSPDEIAALRPLEWISKDMATGTTKRETLRP